MANSADPDPHYLQRQGISGFSRTKVNTGKFTGMGPEKLTFKYR